VENRFQSLPFKRNLQRYTVGLAKGQCKDQVTSAVGLYKLNNPLDPQLESARFQPLRLSSEKTGFKVCVI
jgi:hypothetical protein